MSAYTASLHSSDFALTSIYSDDTAFTWNPDTKWPVNDEGQRLSRSQIEERIQELERLQQLMAAYEELSKVKWVYRKKATTYATEEANLREVIRKVDASLPFSLGNPSETWAWNLEAQLDEVYHSLRILEYQHPLLPEQIFCCPVHYIPDSAFPPHFQPWNRTCTDRYEYYHAKGDTHYRVDLDIYLPSP